MESPILPAHMQEARRVMETLDHGFGNFGFGLLPEPPESWGDASP